MSIIDPMIAEFQHEASLTRKALERVPDDKLDWKPHQKSMSMGRLASHLAEIPHWLGAVLDMDEFTMPEDYKPFAAGSQAELLETFDANVTGGVEAMTGQPDDKLRAVWKMTAGGKILVEMPRVAALRGFIFNHAIHHRAQLTVYLRLNDIPVPSIYGPSADEKG
ncbi:MAG: DinB family protein [Acidobacteriota bacterium]